MRLRIHEHPDYIAANEFKEEFDPKGNGSSSFDWVGAYAKLVFERLHEADRVLDDKADRVIELLSDDVRTFR